MKIKVTRCHQILNFFLARTELSCILYNTQLTSSSFNLQMMKALGLPLGFLNHAPYDLEADGTVVVKQQKPRNRKRKQNGKVHSTIQVT